MDDYLGVLKKSERDLMRELEDDRMNELDEDALLKLHKRVRRARNKHVTNYRRKAANDVADSGARGAAYPTGRKSRHRAEAFEEALAKVSERLADLAHEHAEQLKAERLARARKNRNTGPDTGMDTSAGGVGPGVQWTHAKDLGGVKKDASSQAMGARRQAAKDSRG